MVIDAREEKLTFTKVWSESGILGITWRNVWATSKEKQKERGCFIWDRGGGTKRHRWVTSGEAEQVMTIWREMPERKKNTSSIHKHFTWTNHEEVSKAVIIMWNVPEANDILTCTQPPVSVVNNKDNLFRKDICRDCNYTVLWSGQIMVRKFISVVWYVNI